MTTLNIHQRLHACMGEVDYIQKEKKAGMRYTIVSHDAVTAKVRPVLVKHGIVYYPVALSRSQNGNRTEIDLTVRFANIDEPTDHIDVVAAGYGVDDQDKGPGKAISYAVKYCLLKALGLETGDDPEEAQDDGARHRGAPTPATPSPSATPKTNGHAKPPADARAEAEKIAKAIKDAANIDALSELMDVTMIKRQGLPTVTQDYLAKLYMSRREAMTGVI